MKDKKLSLIATKKQMKQIRKIEDNLDIKFRGKTTNDVENFIEEFKPIAKRIREENNGVSVYSAVKTYNGNDVHGNWETQYDLRDTIAHEKFKGEILRGHDPAEALKRFQREALIEKLSRENDDYDDDFDYEYE